MINFRVVETMTSYNKTLEPTPVNIATLCGNFCGGAVLF